MSGLVDLERMKARLAELDAEREPLLVLIRAAEAYEGVVGRTLFQKGNVTLRSPHHPEANGGRAAPIMAATETAVSEALEVFGPLGTSDLALMLMGKPELNLPSRNAVNVLSARLSNSKRFDNQRGVGWWFKDRPWPPRFVPAGVDLDDEEEEGGDSPTKSSDEAADLLG